MKTLVDAYEKDGVLDAKWDAQAKRALTEFARIRAGRVDTNEPFARIISTNAATAVSAGCPDPMVNYLFIRYAMDQTNSKEAFVQALTNVAAIMEKSSYPAIRKFYAYLRAAEQISYATAENTNTPPEVHYHRRHAMVFLQAALGDKTMPISEVDDACHSIFDVLGLNDKQFEDCYASIEKSLFENWGKEPTVWLLKGEAYYKMAWFARGSGYASEVSKEGWRLFGERLAVAETATKRAWKLDPTDARIPTLMIEIDEGQQKDRKDMELWFGRAMQLNPNNYDACEAKLHYLYPQWYGSRADMIEFGKQCVASKTWGGTVPLILCDAHREYQLYLKYPEERSNYWKQPDVWPDIKASFERFFELNPGATDYYHNYALYAYLAEQWDKLNELLPKLGPVNYEFFGGKEEFDKMVQLARKHSAGNHSQNK